MPHIHTAFLLFIELLFLAWLPLGAFRPRNYLLGNYTTNLVNYVAEVGANVLIVSPITPAPVGIRWISLNLGGQLSYRAEDVVSLATSTYLRNFQRTNNISWQNVFNFDTFNRWLRIRNVRFSDADVFRVFMGENGKESISQANDRTFDVAITLLTYEQHECGFTPMPQDPMKGDTLILNCSVVVNGLWNTSFVFHNYFDGSDTRGEVSECGRQPRIGSKICSTVKVKAKSNIFAYSCRLEFPSTARHDPKDPVFQNSKWTAEFNNKVVCQFPKLYLKSIPSNVAFLCNFMPCGAAASVNDTVTCVADGYPKPVIDLDLQHLSLGHENKSKNQDSGVNYENGFIMGSKVDEEKGEDNSHTQTTIHREAHADNKTVTVERIRFSEDYRIRRRDVGQVELTCNASNSLGWEYNTVVLEIKLKHEADALTRDIEAAAADGTILVEFSNVQVMCNGEICRENHIMKFGDKIFCRHQLSLGKGRSNVILKIDNIEKIVEKPCSYKLKMEDVGKKLVQCIVHSSAGSSTAEANIVVVCAFKHRFGDPHKTEDYDYVVENAGPGESNEMIVLCNDAPCTRPGQIVYTGTYLTCRYHDHRAAYLNMTVFQYDYESEYLYTLYRNKTKPEYAAELYYRLRNMDYGLLTVKCWDCENACELKITVNITVHHWPCPEADSQGEASDAAAAAGAIDVQRSNDGIIATEKPGHRIPVEAEKSNPDVGSCGQESFILLQLLLVLSVVIIGQAQF